MSLDVFIQSTVKLPPIGSGSESICAFEDDGCYWFLHPLFEELSQRTGQYIDLYGGAVFHGPALDELHRTLVAARQLAQLQPDTWEVHIGSQAWPVPQERYSTVHKQELLRLLNTLEAAIEKAKARGACVTFWGD